MLRPLLATLLLAALAGARVWPSSVRAAPAAEPDSVASAFARPSAALMWPGATRAFLVTSEGCLYNGLWRVNIAAAGDGRTASAPRVIAYEGRWMPVAHWTEYSGAVRWDFEAVALPAPHGWFADLERDFDAWSAEAADDDAWSRRRRAVTPGERDRMDRVVVGASHHLMLGADESVPLVVSVLATARNLGRHPAAARIEVSFAGAREREPWFEGGVRAAAPSWGWCASGADNAIGWCEASGTSRAVRRATTLRPGAQCSLRFVVASHPLSAERLAAWSATPHASRTGEARRIWRRALSRGARFELHDPEVEAAINASRVILLSLRERRGGHWVPLGGPFQYRDVWLRDGARAIAALAVHGYTSESRELAASLLQWQWPHGPFVSQGAQLDGTGQAVWAIGEAMLRPAPAPELDRFVTAALDAWAWCERARHATTARPGTVAPGMLPAANPQDNELVQGQLIGSDAWALAGYRSTARLLAAAGRDVDADRVESSRLAYRAAFGRAIARSGSNDVPPSFSDLGRDWGNLAVGYPCQALPASSPRLLRLADRYWSAAGGAGLGTWGSPDSLHGYVAADLGTWAIRAGRRAEADAILDGLLTWRDASGGAGELFTRSGDYGVNLPPHATSAAALLQLVRNSVIDDDGVVLSLTSGARARWWQGARIDRAPTRWGTLSLAFERTGNLARWRWTPVAVWTELVLPEGTRAADVRAPLERGRRPDIVLAPPGTRAATVRLEGVARANGPPSRTRL